MSAAGNRVVVTGMGLVSPLGDSAAALHAALSAGESAIGSLTGVESEGLAPLTGALLDDFDAAAYLGRKGLRSLDRTARLAAVAAGLALADAGWQSDEVEESGMGLVLGTMFGSVRTISRFDRRALEAGPGYAKPMDFANTVLNAAAAQTAIRHRLTGVNATISGGVTSGLQAIAYAADLIRGGRAERLLAGGADEQCFESLYGFREAGVVCGSVDGAEPCARPFDRRRNGFAPAEGAALLVLEDERSARRRGAAILAVVRGQGSGFAAPDERPAAVSRSVGAALADAGCDASEVDCASVSANGGVAGDRIEAEGLARVFNGSAATLPLAAVKAGLGESLGASGAFQACLLIEAMARGTLPGVAGLEAEDDFPIGGVSDRPREVEATIGLVHALGLEGKSCSLVVERGAEGGAR